MSDWQPGPLRRLQLEVVNVCNYRCPLCKTLEKDGVTRTRMSVSEVERVIAPLADTLQEVTLFGTRGEPFLHPELEEIVALVRRSGARTEISTNGSLVTAERASKILDSGLERLVFAVDGLSEETYSRYRRGGTLETVLANLAHLCELRDCGTYGTKVVFQLIPMAHNEHELHRVAEVAYGLGVDEVRLKVSSSVDRSASFRPVDEAYRTLPGAASPRGGFSCPFGLDKLYVDPNGDCFPCCYGEGRAADRIGNALETSILDLWRSSASARYRAPFSGQGEHAKLCLKTCAKRGRKKKLKLARPAPAGSR